MTVGQLLAQDEVGSAAPLSFGLRSGGRLEGTARTRIAVRFRQLVAGRTGLEPTTSGRNPAETQGSEEMKFVSRCIPTSDMASPLEIHLHA